MSAPLSAAEVQRTISAWRDPRAANFLRTLEAEANRWCDRPISEVLDGRP